MQRTPGKHGIADLWYRPDGTPTKLATPGSSPKRADGEGSRWRAWYIDGEGKERTKRFATKAPAEAWLNTQTAALTNGTHVDPRHGKTTLHSFYREYAKHQVWESNTRRAMDLAVNGATFGDVPFNELRLSHVQAWVKSMQDNGLAATTIKTRVTNVRNVLRAAVRDRVLGVDVSDGVKLPRQRRAQAAMTIPTPEDVGKLLDSAEGPWLTFIAVCAFAGLRRGEAVALRLNDVDFMRREIHVSRQAQSNGTGMEYRPPKYASERTVYAPDGLLALLSEHIRQYCPDGPEDRWLFPGKGEDCVAGGTAEYYWTVARAKAGVECRLHDLRHYYASGLIAEGCDPVTVQRAMGHATAAFTLSTYSQLWPNTDDRTRKAAAAMFDQAGGAAYVVRTKRN